MRMKQGDKLYLKEANKTITLGEKVGDGGEAFIFLVEEDSSKVARVYISRMLDSQKIQKLEYMSKMGITIANVTWPSKDDMFYDCNDKTKLLGYLMVKISGKEVVDFVDDEFKKMANNQKSNSANNELHVINYIKSMVAVCKNIANEVQSLHEKEILFADINEKNIMIDGSSLKPYLIDTDSYQIKDKFKCEVSTEGFVAPEILNSPDGINFFGKHLRDMNHESFALATLFFWIIFKGKFPFSAILSNSGLTETNEKVKKLDFTLPIGKLNPTDPSLSKEFQPVAIFWNILGADIQGLFNKAFAKPVQTRPVASEWEVAFAKLEKELDDKKTNLITQQSTQSAVVQMPKVIAPIPTPQVIQQPQIISLPNPVNTSHNTYSQNNPVVSSSNKSFVIIACVAIVSVVIAVVGYKIFFTKPSDNNIADSVAEQPAVVVNQSSNNSVKSVKTTKKVKTVTQSINNDISNQNNQSIPQNKSISPNSNQSGNAKPVKNNSVSRQVKNSEVEDDGYGGL